LRTSGSDIRYPARVSRKAGNQGYIATQRKVPGNVGGWNSKPFRASKIMAPITVRPTKADIAIANTIAAHTNPPTERVAEALTWGADEHLLLAVVGAWWLYSRHQNDERRAAADHVLVTTLVASGLPHLLKRVFDQERPTERPCVVTGAASRAPAIGSTRFRRVTQFMSARLLRQLHNCPNRNAMPYG
jgi:hypothetical protein